MKRIARQRRRLTAMESISKHPNQVPSSPERSRQQTGTIRSKRIKRRKGRARLSLLLLLFLVILLVVFIAKIFIPPPIKASSAILIHADTGRVLYAMHADLPLPPASMSKMMTERWCWMPFVPVSMLGTRTCRLVDMPQRCPARPSACMKTNIIR